jgi:hypothetical protein
VQVDDLGDGLRGAVGQSDKGQRQPLGPRRFGKKTYAAKKPFGSKTSTPRPAGAKSFGQKKTFNKSFSKARPR